MAARTCIISQLKHLFYMFVLCHCCCPSASVLCLQFCSASYEYVIQIMAGLRLIMAGLRWVMAGLRWVMAGLRWVMAGLRWVNGWT